MLAHADPLKQTSNVGSNQTCFVTLSSGIASLPLVNKFLGHQVRWLPYWVAQFLPISWFAKRQVEAIVGWGRRPGTDKAQALAKRLGLPYWALEDGFLRSYGTGDHYPPMSLVIDTEGIYYDSRNSSALETVLNSNADLIDNNQEEVAHYRKQIVSLGLSKYNHAPDITTHFTQQLNLQTDSLQRVLVVDQTMGDMSVLCGGANAQTFHDMLAAARAENPLAMIYVKTHPEVTSGRKQGYLTAVQSDEQTVVVREAINPIRLIQSMQKVYVVTSTMGFEALLAGKPVSCFGQAWYAGWGVTDDRQACPRRNRQRSVNELFSTAYIKYSKYLNPQTHELGSIADVIDWLTQQPYMADGLHHQNRQGRVFLVGMPRWKTYNLKPMLGLQTNQVIVVKDAAMLATLNPTEQDKALVWGAKVPNQTNQGPRYIHLEDGFVRSVGLGSDMVRPLSLVMDEQGLYFDATRESDLENILNNTQFSHHDISRAQHVREFIVHHGITKYNLDNRQNVAWAHQNKEIILVPGQVEDDASIRLGCTQVNTNLALLQAVRAAHPQAFIVYKPHPDVVSGNRKGRTHLFKVLKVADHVETKIGIIDCIDACHQLHTLTSLSGFDALIRGKTVVTYGQPFYAGWGLTIDHCETGQAFERRKRKLYLDELVAGVLLKYPIYWDWQLNGYTRCEAVLQRLLETRKNLIETGELDNLRQGYARRQFRKLTVLVAAHFHHL